MLGFRTLLSSFVRQHLMYKVLITLIFIVTIVIFSHWSQLEFQKNAKKCYTLNTENLEGIQLLEDIMTSSKKPQFSKSIFFHETSCSNGILKLNAR